MKIKVPAGGQGSVMKYFIYTTVNAADPQRAVFNVYDSKGNIQSRFVCENETTHDPQGQSSKVMSFGRVPQADLPDVPKDGMVIEVLLYCMNHDGTQKSDSYWAASKVRYLLQTSTNDEFWRSAYDEWQRDGGGLGPMNLSMSRMDTPMPPMDMPMPPTDMPMPTDVPNQLPLSSSDWTEVQGDDDTVTVPSDTFSMVVLGADDQAGDEDYNDCLVSIGFFLVPSP